jgi:hypothetical protein
MKGKYLIATSYVRLDDEDSSVRHALVNGTSRFFKEFLIGNSSYVYKASQNTSGTVKDEDEVLLPAPLLVILANLGLQALKDLQKQGTKFRLKDGDLKLYE